jgi:hypothetical protein
VTASLLPAVEVPVPSPAVEVQGPSPIAEVAESSSARVALTTEEMMELATCWYVDFPGVGVIDLEAPQFPKRVYEVVAERMFNEPTIMETIASVSKELQEYERAGGFASTVAADAGAWPLRRLQLPLRRQQMRPRRRQPIKIGKHCLPSWWKPLELHPLPQRLTRQRPLSERRNRRRLVLLRLKPKVSRLGCLTSQPRSCKSRPPPG